MEATDRLANTSTGVIQRDETGRFDRILPEHKLRQVVTGRFSIIYSSHANLVRATPPATDPYTSRDRRRGGRSASAR